MLRLVAYTRVSSDGQRDNTSLEGQWERIESYSKALGYCIVEHFSESQSASGKVTRPLFEKALEKVYSKDADGLICMKLDRFARSTIEGLQTVLDINKRGKQLVILDPNLDTSTPIGQCMFTMLLSFAQLERETIAERTANGKKRVRQRNGYVHGQAPYGWTAAEVAGRRWLVRNEYQQQWRQFILDKRKEGWPFQRIADELNRLGVKSKRSLAWAQSSVRQVCIRPSSLIDWIEAQDELVTHHAKV